MLSFKADTKESILPKSTFIPAGDHDFPAWMEHFIANLTSARVPRSLNWQL